LLFQLACYIFDPMKETKKGGKRAGAGRKPVDNPKVQVTIYVEQAHVNNFGGIARLKEALCVFVAAKRSDVNDLVFPKPKPKKLYDDISGQLDQSIEFKPTTIESYNGAKTVLQDENIPEWKKQLELRRQQNKK
jgi:hypothetical protein